MNFSLRELLTDQTPLAQGLSFAGFLAPVMGFYAPKGIVILFGLVGLVGLFSSFRLKDRRFYPPSLFVVSLTAMGFWGVASLGWSVSFDASWTVARSLPFMLLGGYFAIYSARHLNARGRDLVGIAMLAGFSLGVILALIDIGTGFGISKAIHIAKLGGDWSGEMPGFVINNGITVLSMTLWPVCIFLVNKNMSTLAIFAFVAVVIIASQGSNFAAVIAVFAGFLCFLFAYFLPRNIHKLIAAGLIISFLGAPFVINALPDGRTVGADLPELSKSIYPRLVIWQYASNLVTENPLLGHGIRTSRVLNNETKPIDFLLLKNGKVIKGNTKAIPLHPHNGIVQMWLELGGIGALIGLSIVLCVLTGIRKSKTSSSSRAIVYAAFISSICLMSVSYGLWQSWWMGILWLQGAWVLAGLKSQESRVSFR